MTRNLGPARRVARASWVEGVDSTPLWAASPAPRYLAPRSGSTHPVAAVGDATQLEGLVRRTQGPVLPVVYWTWSTTP